MSARCQEDITGVENAATIVPLRGWSECGKAWQLGNKDEIWTAAANTKYNLQAIADEIGPSSAICR